MGQLHVECAGGRGKRRRFKSSSSSSSLDMKHHFLLIENCSCGGSGAGSEDKQHGCWEQPEIQISSPESLTCYRNHSRSCNGSEKSLKLPTFIVLISVVQFCSFVYYNYNCASLVDLAVPTVPRSELLTYSADAESPPPPIETLLNSLLVYCPTKKHELWRFLLYSFLHTSWTHLLFNLLVQLGVGVPLEAAHGSTRTGLIFGGGVLAGSLAVSVFQPAVCLVGGSGGVYALVGAHLADMALNHKFITFPTVRLLAIFGLGALDLLRSAVNRSAAATPSWPWLTSSLFFVSVSTGAPDLPTSKVAHLSGAFGGFTLGLLLIQTIHWRPYAPLVEWLAFGIFSGFMVSLSVFSFLNL